ncbi:hypothetical protein Pla123a_10100 [Posidoniimonas polymericola]|uniref:Amidohydrolase-related domain-containing protein n=1 Tax=Posidoniimonas polymericola TaxID=2528002 RepID=A0A5C5YTT8_9BACT|nr:amidohydrolase family protein [Posidoniimonas polymericola]TWT78220.1 hypothetical protein Pla123a_10100 [Posidoniimonas polymericola]
MPRTLILFALLFACRPAYAEPSLKPVEGLREDKPSLVALTGARIVTAPGKAIESGVVIIEDGVIKQVGPDAKTPPGARVIDLSGKTIYPGFIDAFTEQKIDAPAAGPGYWSSQVTPQRSAAAHYKANEKLQRELRSQGIAARLVAPASGIIKGTSCVALTGDDEQSGAILAPAVAQHAELTIRRRGREDFPNSPMGAVALARQAVLDAQWRLRAAAAEKAAGGAATVPHSAALDALAGCLDGGQLLIADAANELFVLRADRFAREFSLRLAVRGSGNEYRRLADIAKTGRTIIVPVDFPKPPEVSSAEAAADASLEELMHWRLAPENPGRLHQAGVTIALTTDGLKKRGDFLKQVHTAVKRGLPAEAALAALTTTPAELLGVSGSVGTIEAHKLANLVVADGDLFAADSNAKTKVLSTWVAGKEFEINPAADIDLLGEWKLDFKQEGAPADLRLVLTGKAEKPSGKLTVGAEQGHETDKQETAEEEEGAPKKDKPRVNKLKDVRLEHSRLAGRFDGKPIGVEGAVLLSATVVECEDGLKLSGVLRPLAGDPLRFTATRSDDEDSSDDDKDQDAEEEPAVDVEVAVNYPLGAYGRTAAPERPKHVLFRGATVWTCGEQGKLDQGDVLVTDGVIAKVGPSIAAPEGAVVVDARGKHLTPGIIDCHSHMATDGGINEATQAITAEVRIGDMINPDDITIYRQLAGGVTTSNILHGSANPIGGQNQVIKLRWGAGAEAMKLAGAPGGIKWALGENVKQSNWGPDHTTRYPQTRMGVDELHIDALAAARAYQAEHDAWAANPVGVPPRRDLELEALAEILAGERWIHCHSYRQTEIISLLRTLERFGVTIGSLQHILEGYKVAPEMAKHGAMGSSFGDWWAYKFEVYDAIPFNGALMHQAGVVVSFNSDDAEMGRHLNHEAAKAVKYGGVPEQEALKFVTLNPARQLRIDDRVGSLTVGKDADLVLWNAPPLSIYARCEQTWIDGRKYFDLEEDARRVADDQRLHAKLVQAVFDSKEPTAKPGDNRDDPSKLWPRHDEFCHGHGHTHTH